MSITYRTAGPWGAGQGSNLAPTQVDGNFYDLDTRVTTVEDNAPLPIEPISITISGYNFSMGLSNGETLGPVTMTMPVPEWRGDWSPNTQYHDMDFIIAPDGGFGAVMQAHTSASTFDWAATDPGNGLPLYRLIVGSNGMTVSYADLTDVALADLATGDMMVWDGTYWSNRTPAEVAANLPAVVGDSGTGGTKGLVPAPLSGDAAANKFLKANGQWAVPATGSGGSSSLAGLTDVSINTPVNNNVLVYQAGDGKWHNMAASTFGGTVTQVNTGAGLSGGPITAMGTVSLAATASQTLLVNTTAGSAPPAAATLTEALDALAGSTRGSLLQRNAIGWQPLAPGTAGLFLRTGGSGADLTWASPAGNGTVTSITAGAGLSGGTITTAGTMAIAPIADDSVLANTSGGSAPPSGTSVTALLDAAIGTARGSVIRRDGTAWTALPPGTAGQVLTSGGAGADVSWGAGGGGGASVSIGDAPPASPTAGDLWWSSADGNLYIRYLDPSSDTYWISAVNQPGPAGPAGSTWTVGTGLTLNTATEPDTLSLSIPVAIVNGGTGSQTPADARAALSAAAIDSQAFTGSPSLPTGTTAVTQAAATNNTSIATTAFVKQQNYTTGGPYLPTAGGSLSGSLTVNGTISTGQDSAAYLRLGRYTSGFTGAVIDMKDTAGGSNHPTFLDFQFNGVSRATIDNSAGLTVNGKITQNFGGGRVQQLNATSYDDVQIALFNSSYTWLLCCQAASLSNYFGVYDATAGRWGLHISPAGSCSASSTWAVISDMRLKEASSIQEYPRGLQEILALNPIYYQWNGKGGVPADGELHYGLAAQDVEAVLPELIREMEYTPPEDAREDDEPMTLKTYSPTDIVFSLIGAVKELQTQIDELRAQLPPPMQPEQN